MKFIEIEVLAKIVIPLHDLYDENQNDIEDDEYTEKEILQELQAGSLSIPFQPEDIEIEKIKKIHCISG